MKFLMQSICFGAFIILFSSCKKDESIISTSIIGEWELRQTLGDMGLKNYPPGNGNILKYTKSNFQSFNGQSVTSGYYKIVFDATAEANLCLQLPSNEFRNRIIYDNNLTDIKKFIQISNNRLILRSGCFGADGGVRLEYERQ
ncbi:MAG: hypothetical protein ABIN97_10160 [Ginsengibacter sp.]